MQRTIRIQLQPDIETAKVLFQTIEQYTWSFNDVCKHGWENDLANGVELHKATYYDHRAITGLPSQLVCAARVKATEALKSAKRHLKKLSGSQRRFRKDCDHVLSKRLARSVNSGATLVFEDLTNIRGNAKMRKAQRRRLHEWSFAQFQAFVTYKAEARGVNIGFVDPRYTSQKCSQCGHIERGNRPSQAEFRCKKCGYECHADYNAAMNIREDFLKLRVLVPGTCVPAKKHPEGAAVNQPIVVCPEMGT